MGFYISIYCCTGSIEVFFSKKFYNSKDFCTEKLGVIVTSMVRCTSIDRYTSSIFIS